MPASAEGSELHVPSHPVRFVTAAALFDGPLEIGEYANQSLIKYSKAIGATHIVRGLREATNFNEEFNLHGLAGRIDPA